MDLPNLHSIIRRGNVREIQHAIAVATAKKQASSSPLNSYHDGCTALQGDSLQNARSINLQHPGSIVFAQMIAMSRIWHTNTMMWYLRACAEHFAHFACDSPPHRTMDHTSTMSWSKWCMKHIEIAFTSWPWLGDVCAKYSKCSWPPLPLTILKISVAVSTGKADVVASVIQVGNSVLSRQESSLKMLIAVHFREWFPDVPSNHPPSKKLVGWPLVEITCQCLSDTDFRLQSHTHQAGAQLDMKDHESSWTALHRWDTSLTMRLVREGHGFQFSQGFHGYKQTIQARILKQGQIAAFHNQGEPSCLLVLQISDANTSARSCQTFRMSLLTSFIPSWIYATYHSTYNAPSWRHLLRCLDPACVCVHVPMYKCTYACKTYTGCTPHTHKKECTGTSLYIYIYIYIYICM